MRMVKRKSCLQFETYKLAYYLSLRVCLPFEKNYTLIAYENMGKLSGNVW